MGSIHTGSMALLSLLLFNSSFSSPKQKKKKNSIVTIPDLYTSTAEERIMAITVKTGGGEYLG